MGKTTNNQELRRWGGGGPPGFNNGESKIKREENLLLGGGERLKLVPSKMVRDLKKLREKEMLGREKHNHPAIMERKKENNLESDKHGKKSRDLQSEKGVNMLQERKYEQ